MFRCTFCNLPHFLHLFFANPQPSPRKRTRPGGSPRPPRVLFPLPMQEGRRKSAGLKVKTNPQACHCEPVRTLAWQSVLFKNVHIPRLRDADRHTGLIGRFLRDDMKRPERARARRRLCSRFPPAEAPPGSALFRLLRQHVVPAAELGPDPHGGQVRRLDGLEASPDGFPRKRALRLRHGPSAFPFKRKRRPLSPALCIRCRLPYASSDRSLPAALLRDGAFGNADDKT